MNKIIVKDYGKLGEKEICILEYQTTNRSKVVYKWESWWTRSKENISRLLVNHEYDPIEWSNINRTINDEII